jgi:hypothetical protein
MVKTHKTSKSNQSPSDDRRTSLARGFAWAVPLGVGGFCVPFLVLGLALLGRILFADMPPADRAADLRQLPANGIESAVACGLMLAFAALANFSPARGIGFLRSLVVMGVVVLVAFVATGIAIMTFGIGPRSYTSDPYLGERLTLFAALIAAGGIRFTHGQLRRPENER